MASTTTTTAAAATPLAYTVPSILNSVRPFINYPRHQYSTNFPAFLELESEEHIKYRDGLIVLGGCVGIVMVVWMIILIFFKCRGEAVGCASGMAFQVEPNQGSRRTRVTGNTIETEEESYARYAYRRENQEDLSFRSSIHSSDLEDRYSEDLSILRPSRREQRTQLCFLLFSSITVICIPMCLLFVFGPLKETLDASDEQVLSARDVLSEMDTSLNTVVSAMAGSATVLGTVSTNFTALCPAIPEDMVGDSPASNLYELVKRLEAGNLGDLHTATSKHLQDLFNFTKDFTTAVDLSEDVYQETNKYLWILPGLLLALSSLTVIILFGVMLSWKRQSSKSLQNTLSYGILPFFIMICFISWVFAIGTAVATAVVDDVCNAGSSNGNPSETVLSILDVLEFDKTNNGFSYIVAYTGGCSDGVDPTRNLQLLEDSVRQEIDHIWSHLSAIDTSGREDFIEACEGTEPLDLFLDQARDLARLMTTIRRAIDSLTSSLQCSRVHPIYVEAVEQSVCTEAAAASACGLVFFFTIGVSTLIMISLRASWRHYLSDEDPIYDEDEVAENMFVDEHEEYLAYISKYKHEWDDYCGINAEPKTPLPPTVGTPVRTTSVPSTFEYGMGSRSNSDAGSERMRDNREPQYMYARYPVKPSRSRTMVSATLRDASPSDHIVQEPFDPYSQDDVMSPTTIVSGEISFLSLNESQTLTHSHQPPKRDLERIQPLPLPSARKSNDVHDTTPDQEENARTRAAPVAYEVHLHHNEKSGSYAPVLQHAETSTHLPRKDPVPCDRAAKSKCSVEEPVDPPERLFAMLDGQTARQQFHADRQRRRIPTSAASTTASDPRGSYNRGEIKQSFSASDPKGTYFVNDEYIRNCSSA